MTKITIQNIEANVIKVDGEDYICLTDMLCAKDGDFFITDWLRNRNTLECIGLWEKVYNPDFNYGEFATIRNKSGQNSHSSDDRFGKRHQWRQKVTGIIKGHEAGLSAIRRFSPLPFISR